MTDLKQLNNPIAESYWRALLVRELEDDKATLKWESEHLVYERAIKIVKGNK